MLIGDLNIGGHAPQGLGQYPACQFRAVVLSAQVRRYQRAQTGVAQRERDAARRFIGEMSVWAANAPFQCRRTCAIATRFYLNAIMTRPCLPHPTTTQR